MIMTTKKTSKPEPEALGGDVGNGGKDSIEWETPFVASITIEGVCPILWRRWQSDVVAAKANSPKNSAARKTDDIETFVYRDDKGTICLPGEYLRGTLVNRDTGAARFRPDPRSHRKSALDLWTGLIQSLTELAPIKKANGRLAKNWDYVDRRRVRVNRSAITRERPALNTGYQATVQLMCQSEQYISPHELHSALIDAGRLVGLGDFRPTFGRFQVIEFKTL
jgi:hypothetical protein